MTYLHPIAIVSDSLLQAKLKFAAQELNLREHMVNRTVLYSACDVEGHKGKCMHEIRANEWIGSREGKVSKDEYVRD